MANFKGFKQVLLADYLSASTEDKKGYIWFVRELSGDTTTSAAVYFGTRKYAEINADGKEANIIASLGDMVDENGNWLGFIPTEDHEILGTATDATDAFEKIEAAVLNIKARVTSAETRISAVEESISILESRANSADTRMDNIEETIEENERVTASALTSLNTRVTVLEGDITALTQEVATKASQSDLDTLEGRVAANEDAITALTQEVNLKANASDVYTKAQTYNREEIDGKIAGTFKFMGEAVRISEDKKTIYILSGETEIAIVAAEENRGHVYQIGEKEYASNGELWVELGFNVDLSQYAKKTYVDSAVTAEETARIAADENLSEQIDELDSALTAEIEARIALGERVTTAESNIENLDTRATFSAQTFDDVVLSAMTQGQIVYVATDEQIESGRTKGAYIKIGDTLKKLDTSTGSGDTPLDRIEALENKVGSTVVPGDKTLTEAVSMILTITGEDVE